MNTTTKQYAERDHMELDASGGHYSRHVDAMTREGLHSKSDIAAELAWRDDQIAKALKAGDALIHAVKRMHAAKGRYHSQHATCDLYELLGLPCTRETIAPSPPPADSVPVPQNADQAQMMVGVGLNWLEHNAPERLKKAAPAGNSALIARLDREAGAGWSDGIAQLLADCRAALASAPAADPVLEWCVHCGEGTTGFCRSKCENRSCPKGLQRPGQDSDPQAQVVATADPLGYRLPDALHEAIEAYGCAHVVEDGRSDAKWQADCDEKRAALVSAIRKFAAEQPNQEVRKVAYRAAWDEFCKVKEWTDSEFAAVAARVAVPPSEQEGGPAAG